MEKYEMNPEVEQVQPTPPEGLDTISHSLFVREDGPDAWGACFRVKKGDLIRASRKGAWSVENSDRVAWLCCVGSVVEVYHPGDDFITEYKTYPL